MNYQAELDRSFDALSHPARRAIVERLVAGPSSVGEASVGLGISKPAVTKHLKVLELAGVVTRTVRGRTHLLRLEPRPLREASQWLELHRSLWEAKFEAVERHLAETLEGQEVPE
ncbi:MAG TPA: metalloregulator ArsR/SmtB family transcription factor [Gaiellaceae bacterium]|nr:metalloregulator ArsR/SmtB family transcription factor [Gaiellaceae bacterium]